MGCGGGPQLPEEGRQAPCLGAVTVGLAAACPASTSAGVLATGPAPSGPHSGPLRPPSGLAESQTHREREEQMFSLHDKSKQ